MIEIERKFLVTSEDFKTASFKQTRITQGFLNTDAHRTVRVRIQGDKAFLTIKGKSTDDGLKRFEWETEIKKTDAEVLLKMCEANIIDKTRFEVKQGNHIFEVDEFFGANEGLIIAEIELHHEAEDFEAPSWLGQEVTGDIKYYNSQLSRTPYKNWKS